MLVRLSETLHVNPAEVSSVVSNYETERVIVTMRNGEVHRVGRAYREWMHETESRILALLTPKVQDGS